MFKVYSDDILIHDSKSPSLDVHLVDPTLKMSDSVAGTFDFTVPPNNPGYDKIDQRLSTIKIYRDSKLIWTGRVITENEDFWKRRNISCEGALAFLNDSNQLQHSYSDASPESFLQSLIDIHNSRVSPSRRFKLGIVTVRDTQGDGVYKTEYENTLEVINKNLKEPLGGHIFVTYDSNDEMPTLNYFANNTLFTAHQVINFGENLLDFTKDWDLSDLCTVLIPRGKQLDSEEEGADPQYVTIAPVNSGSVYLRNAEAINQYGVIEKVVDFSDVEDPAILKEFALLYMSSIQFNKMTLKVTAIDLHILNPDIIPFELLEEVQCVSPPHGLNKIFPITEIDLPLDKPDSVVYTLGYEPTSTMSTQSVLSVDTLQFDLNKKTDTVLTAARAHATKLINSATTGYVNIITENDAAQAIIISNTQNIADATKLWRWNLNGLGYSDDGGQTYRLAMTMDGSIVADFITTGTMNADLIKTGTMDADLIRAGVLQDVEGNNYWNLETGELSMSAGATIGGLTANEIAYLTAEASVNTLEYTVGKNSLRIAEGAMIDWENTDNMIMHWFGTCPNPDKDEYSDTSPSRNWTTDAIKLNHVGDCYYNTETGRCWTYHKGTHLDPETHRYSDYYFWWQCKDEIMKDLLVKLSETDRVQDGFIRVFYDDPATPYAVGDIWYPGEDSYAYVAVTARSSGTVVNGDWLEAITVVPDTELKNFITSEYANHLIAIKGQVDQKAETWYQSTDPSLRWADADRATHTGDLWYNTNNHTTWRYTGTGWEQQNVPDDVFDKIDGKAQIFISQPTVPYNAGDLWFNSETSDIMTCIRSRDEGSFTASEWQKRNKYTDDSALTNFVNGTYATDIRNIGGQLDKKAETWYQETDPATNWSASEKPEHVGDLWYKTSDSTTWRYTGTGWAEQAAPDSVFDAIDGKAQIFVNTPVPPYNVGDLWFNSTTSDIMTCITAKESGAYDAADWQKRNKYTDDTAVTTLDRALNQAEVFKRLTNNGALKGIYMENGNLYINGTYIKSGIIDGDLIQAGTITDKSGNNVWNLDTGVLTIGGTSSIGDEGMTVEELIEAAKSAEDLNVRVFPQYALSTDPTKAPTTGWSDTMPEWKFGYSMWERTATVINNGDPVYTNPQNASKGDATQLTVKGVKFNATGINTISGDPYARDVVPPDKSDPQWSSTPPHLPKGQMFWSAVTYANDHYLVHRTYMKGNNNVNAVLVSVLVSTTDNTEQLVFYVDGRRIYKTVVLDSGVNADFQTDIGYVHLCWSMFDTGYGFSKTPANRALLGYFLDSNPTDSGSDITKYNWSPITSLTYAWDEDARLQESTIQYYLSTSSSQPTDGEWLDTMPDWIKGRYYWTRTKTVVGNDREAHTSYGDPVLAKGLNKANDAYVDAGQALSDAADANQSAADAMKKATSAETTANNANSTASSANTNASNAMSIATNIQAVIRILSGGILVTKRGYTIGAYVNGQGYFDIVPVSWSGDNPNIGTYAYARYGAFQQLGQENASHVYIDTTGIKFYGKNSSSSSVQQLVHMGYGTTYNNSTSSTTAPYYTLGTRKSGSNNGTMSTVLGENCTASRGHAVAEGCETVAAGYCSHAEGLSTNAGFNYSHAEGSSTKASALCAHAEGGSCTASGQYSHAQNSGCTASGMYSHAGGNGSTASAEVSFVHGEDCTANGKGGAAFGWKTTAGYYQLSCGSYNSTVSSASGSVYYYFTVGIGTSTKKDGFTVNSAGTAWAQQWATASDRRLKDHIEYLDPEESEAFVMGLNPVLYSLKFDGSRHLGFYAQDVEEIENWDANIVTEANHGEDVEGLTKSLDYQALIAPLVATVQKQNKTIKEQQQKIESLEERLKALENLVASIAQ